MSSAILRKLQKTLIVRNRGELLEGLSVSVILTLLRLNNLVAE